MFRLNIHVTYSLNFCHSVRFKPFSVAYWLDGFSKDDDLPEDDDIVACIDPDMIFLSSDVNLGSIKDNRGVASQYSLGSAWVRDWALQFCDGKCDVIADPSDVSFNKHADLPGGGAPRAHPEARGSAVRSAGCGQPDRSCAL